MFYENAQRIHKKFISNLDWILEQLLSFDKTKIHF